MDQWTTIDGYIVVKETEKAVGLAKSANVIDRNTALVWVPRSCCQDGERLEEGDEDITVATWFVEKEGLDA